VILMERISNWRRKLERYRLLAVKCRRCKAIYYPIRSKCLKCGSEDLEYIELPKRGILESYTVIYTAPSRFTRYTPYIVGLIKLDNGVKILAQLTDVNIDEIHIGMHVEATLRRLYDYGDEDQIVYGVKFRPVIE